jgi:hypothetical protein
MTAVSDQLAALERIATFSAALRGHALGEPAVGEGFMLARCIHCGAALRINFPALQPDIEGPALEDCCVPPVYAEQAA